LKKQLLKRFENQRFQDRKLKRDDNAAIIDEPSTKKTKLSLHQGIVKNVS